MAFHIELVIKNPPANTGEIKRHGFSPQIRKIPWRRAWQPTPVFLPGESHGQRNLAGCTPWGQKESDTIEATQHTCKRHQLQEKERAFHLEVWLSLPISPPQSTLAPGTGDNMAFYFINIVDGTFIFIYFLGCVTSRILIPPPPGIEPVVPSVEAWSLNHWTTREVQPEFEYEVLKRVGLPGWH